jgi:hypothetical protein
MKPVVVFLVTIAFFFIVLVFIPFVTRVPEVLDSTPYVSVQNEEFQNNTPDKASTQLNAMYTPADPIVYVDYEAKEIGECPDAKPQSKDLPLRDIPVNVMNTMPDMRLV